LILAPTGSGKTLAAFLWCLDQLATRPVPTDSKQRCRVLYVSPLKALAHDVERNLKAPLVGIDLAAQRLNLPPPSIDVAIRLGEMGRFLAGVGRPVTLVDVGKRKRLDLQVVVPLEDMEHPALGADEPTRGGSVLGADVRAEARNSVWPSIYPRLLELIKSQRSTLIFVNSRRLAERLAQRLNELAEAESDADPGGPPLVRAHHGSISREQRLVVEEMLKSGTVRGLVATSSLELGIDMGAIDLVIQVESPTSVASGLQRMGRAGHTVDA